MTFIRLILIFILAYVAAFVIRAFLSFFRTRPKNEEKPKTLKTMVKDEVCNMYIPKDEALREVKDGREYYFCSQACRSRFLEKARLTSTSPEK